MEESILNEIKQMLGLIDPEYTVFDSDIMAAINSAIGTLNQLGIGTEGFFLTGSQQNWSSLLGTSKLGLQLIKEYVFMKVKVAFDPPTASFVLDSYNNIIKELEWRLNVMYETNAKSSGGGHCCEGLTPDQLDSLIDLVDDTDGG